MESGVARVGQPNARRSRVGQDPLLFRTDMCVHSTALSSRRVVSSCPVFRLAASSGPAGHAHSPSPRCPQPRNHPARMPQNTNRVCMRADVRSSWSHPASPPSTRQVLVAPAPPFPDNAHRRRPCPRPSQPSHRQHDQGMLTSRSAGSTTGSPRLLKTPQTAFTERNHVQLAPAGHALRSKNQLLRLFPSGACRPPLAPGAASPPPRSGLAMRDPKDVGFGPPDVGEPRPRVDPTLAASRRSLTAVS